MSTALLIVCTLSLVVLAVLAFKGRSRALKPLQSNTGGKMGTLGDPWSSLGPNTNTYSAVTGGVTIPAYYKRQSIRLSIDTGGTGSVYGLLGTTGGPPSASNFHFALSTTLPPLELEYTGAIQLASSTGTIKVGAIEN